MAGKQLKTMDVSALLELRGKIDALLAAKREELESQLAAFNSGNGGGHVVGNGKIAKAKVSNGKTGKRAKAAAPTGRQGSARTKDLRIPGQ